jgi:hypothetical protein
MEGWKDWEVAGLLGGGFWPQGKAEWQHTLDPTDFENRINAATHKTGINTAVYLGKTFDDLSVREVEAALAYCNSPLTDRLKEKFGAKQDFHAKAILHLEEFLRGATPTLTDLDQMEAWARLLERSGNAIYRVCSRGRLKASSGAGRKA